MVTRRNADLPRATDLGSPRNAQDTLGSASTPEAVSLGEVSAEDRKLMIAQAAYGLAEARGFSPGHELEDWFAAELKVNTVLAAGQRAPAH